MRKNYCDYSTLQTRFREFITNCDDSNLIRYDQISRLNFFYYIMFTYEKMIILTPTIWFFLTTLGALTILHQYKVSLLSLRCNCALRVRKKKQRLVITREAIYSKFYDHWRKSVYNLQDARIHCGISMFKTKNVREIRKKKIS